MLNSFEASYSRVGLRFNPFFFLSSEAIDSSLPISVEEVHVYLPIDQKILFTLKEVESKRIKKLVFLIGVFGLGKTERAKLLQNTLQRKNFIPIYMKVDTSNPKVLIQSILKSLAKAYEREFSPPIIGKIKRDKNLEWLDVERLIASPRRTFVYIRNVMDSLAPLAIILDELENMLYAHADEQRFFFSFLLSLYNIMPSSSLLIISCIPEALSLIKALNRKFFEKITDIIRLTPLSDEDSIKLAEKRIRLARIEEYETEDPLYPFTQEAIVYANHVARGNARELLKLLRTALSALIADPNVAIIDKNFMQTVVRSLIAPLKVERLVKKKKRERELAIPEDFLEDLKILIEDFGGGPASYIQIARKTRRPAILQLKRLERLEELGIIKGSSGRYFIPPEMKRRIAERIYAHT